MALKNPWPAEIVSQGRQNRKTDLGTIKLRREVISSIAGLAAQEVEGVYGLLPSLMSKLGELFGKKSYDAGVKVELGDADAKITIFVIVEYGVNIPEIANSVQDNVRQAIDKMTGIANVEVNVEISGIAPRKEVKE